MELEKYLIAEEGIIGNFLKKRAEKKEKKRNDKLYKKYLEAVVIPKIPPKAIELEKKYMLKDLNVLLSKVKAINNDFNRKFGDYVAKLDGIYVFYDELTELVKAVTKIGSKLSYEDYILLANSTNIMVLRIDMDNWSPYDNDIFEEIVDFCDAQEAKLKALPFKYITKISGGMEEAWYDFEIETQNSSEEFKKVISGIESELSFETWKSNPANLNLK